jgi:hypothetical protein
MNKPDANGELTSTLHLGLRSVVDGSPESALNALLSSASETDRLAITAVIEGLSRPSDGRNPSRSFKGREISD